MDTKSFRTPMVIYGPRGFLLISTMDQASDFLFDNWPGNDSKAWTDAMTSCASDGSADDARVAFLAAIAGAGMRVDPIVSFY
ncbi:DUF982 domain-containing protein [Pseudaminobacter salicylatoxidans]|uniref:DUF982 domain-containing protein n=1 Tax=Pseudaminobacter salicylatoxidans TaxID=93369 RepID=UPI000312BE40|nr:DUF982 domain-containing protein [Pseudaminobacter salicylatoxidans]